MLPSFTDKDTTRPTLVPTEALEGLAQLANGRGEKAALCQIGTIGLVARPVGRLARQSELGYNLLLACHVAEVGGEPGVTVFDGTHDCLHWRLCTPE